MTDDQPTFDEIYEELRRIAVRFMRGERSNHTLQPTALVHEVYIRLCPDKKGSWESRAHFLSTAARAVRRVLVDHARLHGAREGRMNKITLGDQVEDAPDIRLNAIALDEAVQKLTEKSKRKSQIVELRFFAGLTIEETAKVLGLSSRLVDKEWRFARAWLRREVSR